MRLAVSTSMISGGAIVESADMKSAYCNFT